MSSTYENEDAPSSGFTRTRPQCMNCLRRRTLTTCTAFSGPIPVAILTNQADHREPYPGDHGQRWEPDGDHARHPLDTG